MSLTRADLSNQIQKSTSFPGVLVSDNANEAYWLASPSGDSVDKILFYDHSGVVINYLTLGAGLSIAGTVLDTVAGGPAYNIVREEGVNINISNTILDFIGSGITAADATGGVTSVTLDSTLNALAGFNSNGYLVQTATDTFTARTLTGTTGRLTVSNGDGSVGNPVFNVDPNFASTNLFDTSNIMLLNNSQTVTGVKTFDVNIILNGTPTIGSHGVNKDYVDGLVAGFSNTRVDVATTANIALSGEQTIDTVLTSASDVLVKDQTLPEQNGIYTTAAGAWTRRADMNAAGEVQGTFVLIGDGSQEGQLWLTVSEVVTLGTDPIVFSEFSPGTIDGVGAADRIAVWSDTDTLGSDANFKYASSQMVIGDTAYATATVLTTKGSTTNNSAWGLAHLDSAGVTQFKVSNTGVLTLGTTTTAVINTATSTFNNASGYTILTSAGSLSLGATTSVVLQGGGTSSTAPSVLANITRSDLTSNQFNTSISGTFNPSGAGTNTYTDLLVAPTINQTTHTGITYSQRIAPTLTSVGSGGHVALSITATSQTALHTTAGNVKFDIPSAADNDTFYRVATTGVLGRVANGTTGQVYIATTGAAPSWGAVPTVVSEAYLEGSSSTTVDLDSGSSVKDVDGNNIAFTIPTDTKKFHVYRGGIHQSMSGTVTTRDYSVNTTTHVITFAVALTTDEIVKFVKFE